MSPYAAEMSRTTGLPVYDFHSVVCSLQAGLQPRTFGA